MFNNSYLTDAIACYKKDFIQMQWPNEKYKWEAVKCFQDNWDVNAADFADMLTRSLAKTYNLLVSMNNFPGKMIEGFAKAAPEEVRAMYLALFDETQDVISRSLAFKDQAGILLEKYGNGAAQHYQYENAITTYLWLRYPDKYYIYKYSEVKSVVDELKSSLQIKKSSPKCWCKFPFGCQSFKLLLLIAPVSTEQVLVLDHVPANRPPSRSTFYR